MADFLIKNQTSGGETPGDIVEVRPDGGCPGGRLEEDPERFIIIKVPGLDVAEALNFMDALIDDDDPENPITIHRRRYSIEDALGLLGPYHVSGNVYQVEVHASWNSFIKDKGLV